MHSRKKKAAHIATAPFIYVIFFAIVVLDFFIELYHHVCFPVYGINKITRSEYIRIDRQKLEYLTYLQKLNCIYCGYVNGFLRYAVQIGAATERYWCGIKHKEDAEFKNPEHHKDFLPYDDKDAFQTFIKK